MGYSTLYYLRPGYKMTEKEIRNETIFEAIQIISICTVLIVSLVVSVIILI